MLGCCWDDDDDVVVVVCCWDDVGMMMMMMLLLLLLLGWCWDENDDDVRGREAMVPYTYTAARQAFDGIINIYYFMESWNVDIVISFFLFLGHCACSDILLESRDHQLHYNERIFKRDAIIRKMWPFQNFKILIIDNSNVSTWIGVCVHRGSCYPAPVIL